MTSPNHTMYGSHGGASSTGAGGAPGAGPTHRQSRVSMAVSTRSLESGELRSEAPEQHLEEIEAIRRYEDFTTIDWVQDAARAQLRRRIRQQRKNGFWVRGRAAVWRRKLAESYDAGQAWIVVSLIGTCIGLNAAFLNIVTEWLSDIKQGHCTTAFYLNENFCCWGSEHGCDEWKTWTSFGLLNYIIYILFSVLLAFTSAFLVKSFAPYAAGSGISEIKCIIAGFIMKGFLGWQTLLIKSIGLPLAIASGLSVGKEGPSVHYAVCTGNVISRFFGKYRKNAAKMREILSACAAAGVAVAFGSPIGGVIFSLEEMAPHFPLKTMWRSYFCALVATAVLAAMNPFRTGQLVMFQVSYDRDWHFFEVVFFILLGVFGGLYGEFVIKWNLRAQAFRKKYLKQYAIAEVLVLAMLTAAICYPNMFLRIDMTETMEIVFRECEGGVADYNGLCEPKNRWRMVFSLLTACVIRLFLVIISYGCKVPAGIFVPSMAIGATFGRAVGILVQALHEAMPDSRFFAACQPDVPCITPGTYAFLGAAAALSGIMHITVAVVVIMFELTGALTYILPTMIVVGVTKSVSERLGKGGIADRMIWFNGFPYLDTKEEHTFGVPVSHVMITELTVLPCANGGLELHEVERILKTTKFQGFPVVQDREGKMLLGYLGRTEMLYGIERAKRERGSIRPTTKCYFGPPPEGGEGVGLGGGITQPAAAVLSGAAAVQGSGSGSGQQIIDFSRFVDPTPLTVHPSLPLETVMEIFKKLGPRVVLVEYRGKLCGCVTIKDCLAYQAKAENRENKGVEEYIYGIKIEEGQERLWEWIVWCVEWVGWRLGVRRGPPSSRESSIIMFSDEEDEERNEEGDENGSGARRNASGMGVARMGTVEESENEVELEVRR
ncbi:chloride channel [Kalaharituber pfeilii]|nr:chloride channel [Kalaharituber pfeilii]